MMLTAKKVMKEMAEGLAAVCAWCEHWHNAKDRGEEVMCGQLKCGGPMTGKGFPAYKGIMHGQLHTFCFICGKDAEAGVEVKNRMLGICNRMGPNNQTCMDRLKFMLANPNSGKKIIVTEQVVPIIDGGKKELGDG